MVIEWIPMIEVSWITSRIYSFVAPASSALAMCRRAPEGQRCVVATLMAMKINSLVF